MARTPAAVADVQKLLLARAAMDASLDTWESWGEIAAALGRLPYDTPAAGAAEAVPLTGLPAPDSLNDVETAALAGSARGFESLARTSGRKSCRRLASAPGICCAGPPPLSASPADPRSAMTRRLAMAALVTGNQATTSVIERGLNDADAEVRRFAAAAAAPMRGSTNAIASSQLALADKEPRVRFEALRAWGRHLQKTSCAPIRAAVRDPNPHVMLQAIDQLGTAVRRRVGCRRSHPRSPSRSPTPRAPGMRLRTRSSSLARIQPEAATVLPRYIEHPTWQVRMYAARAAGVLGLERCSRCSGRTHDNVSEAALAAMIDAEAARCGAAAIASLDAMTIS